MIDIQYASLYYPVFYWSILLFSIIQFYLIQDKSYKQITQQKISGTGAYFFSILFIFFVGFRPNSILFGDTVVYARDYALMSRTTTFQIGEGKDWLFSVLMYNCSKFLNSSEFFFIIEILYVVPIIIACKRLLPKNWPILLLICFCSFSFFSYSVNGIRNGMACSLVILAITLIKGNIRDKIICAFLCFIAINIHRSTTLPIIAMLIAYLKPNIKYWIILWIIAIPISFIGGNTIMNAISSIGYDDRMFEYANIKSKDILSSFSGVGFRWDFIIYSFMPILLGYYIAFKRRITDPMYNIILCTYIISNAFWIMIIRIPFSNRFAYLSWFLYPIVIGYPILKLKVWKFEHGYKTSLVLLAHTGFTFFMWFIGK